MVTLCSGGQSDITVGGILSPKKVHIKSSCTSCSSHVSAAHVPFFTTYTRTFGEKKRLSVKNFLTSHRYRDKDLDADASFLYIRKGMIP